MARGESRFNTMDCADLKADNPNATLYKHNLEKPARDVDINGGPETKVYEEDPMRNLMSKGLVHHMRIPQDVVSRHQKGFVKDAINEARASTTKQSENTMRGNAGFTVMKGFETKGSATEPECLPSDPGQDVLDEEKLSNKAKNGEAPKKPLKVDEDDLTMADDLNLVGEKAKEDIADGYVADIQGEKVSSEKGFGRYNEMVEKGMAVDIDMNPHNVGAALDALESHVDGVYKAFDVKKKF